MQLCGGPAESEWSVGSGGVIYVWNGRGASTEHRKASTTYAQELITKLKLPQGTPVKLVKEVCTSLGLWAGVYTSVCSIHVRGH